MCQEAGREGCAAHSSEHSAPVGNRVLVTGVDPCKGRRRVREAADFLRGLNSERDGDTHAQDQGQHALQHPVAWHAARVVTAHNPATKRYHKLFQPCPCPSRLLPALRHNPTEKSQHEVTHRRHKSVAAGHSGLRESHSLLPVAFKRPHSC